MNQEIIMNRAHLPEKKDMYPFLRHLLESEEIEILDPEEHGERVAHLRQQILQKARALMAYVDKKCFPKPDAPDAAMREEAIQLASTLREGLQANMKRRFDWIKNPIPEENLQRLESIVDTLRNRKQRKQLSKLLKDYEGSSTFRSEERR